MRNNDRYILTIDAGTTSVRTLLYDTKNNTLVNIHGSKISQFFPHNGWVDQDANEIWLNIYDCLISTTHNIDENEIVGLGITNQRETIVLWNKATGEPIAPAICWQDKRTDKQCRELANNKEINDMIYSKTGLFPNCYFSASSLQWLLNNTYDARQLLKDDNLCCGTIDSYLVYRLTQGKSFIIEASNASRTMLYNINTNDWDDDLLELFHIPRQILPTVVDSNAYVGDAVINGKTIKIGGILGDQQASLFGQACFDKGNVKSTYGTGAFMLLNTGNKPTYSDTTKCLSTIAWRINDKTTYALEGSILNAGSCMTWLENIGMLKEAKESGNIACSVQNTDGVYFVPALSGLGAPYWEGSTKGTFTGLTLGTQKAHMVRAVLESICYNTRAVMEKMIDDSGVKIKSIRVDGGMARNEFVMQKLSNTLQTEIILSNEIESTSVGAAFMCGLAFGVFKDFDDLRNRYKIGKVYQPQILKKAVDEYYKEWQRAVSSSIELFKNEE